MQRSSESIAALATALAKAQGELVNPEKSSFGSIKVGTGRGVGADEGTERLFRYAPLSSGLDIVRKTLGQHEIATIQTTAIDQNAGQVNLTTLLAHASGEWIASDWPVCPIAETANPRRMGAALTYARRYALFTLVGIAGEDDLDAPDLMTPTTTQPSVPERPTGASNGRLNGGRHNHAQRAVHPHPAPLGIEASGLLRDRLLAELNELGGGDDAALWAKGCLPEKNRMTAADAQRVEESFQARLMRFAADPAGAPLASIETEPVRAKPKPRRPKKQTLSKRIDNTIDKSVLTLSEPRRIRDRDHVRFVATQACLVCGRQPSDAHHLRFAQSRALGRKVSDEFTVPLCRGHHREVHRQGDEAMWWPKAGIDPILAARTLWLETHPVPVVSAEVHEVESIKTVETEEKKARPVGRSTSDPTITKRSQTWPPVVNDFDQEN
jgi:hypothetical protein